MRVALLCGGPSLERGISLNSARCAMDHLQSPDLEIVPIYLDSQRKPYKISKAELYCNTPSDFDFKLHKMAMALSNEGLLNLLKKTDLVFPVMHGPFGEDGGIQSFLEKHGLPFVGSGSEACKKAFDKFRANEFIRRHGFFTLPSVVLKIYHPDHKQILEKFFKEHKIKRAIVKPASGGSSIGVFSVSNVNEALQKARLLFSKRMDTRVVVEPFARGAEFTLIILENRFGLPVALPPTEIETDYAEHQIFDFRKKYLPTRRVKWHCPPRFGKAVIDRIQAEAEQLFALFGMRDFGRFDGWVLPDGNIWFCDFNTISGMEQNSFLFQQASRIGMTHGGVLRHIVRRASERQEIPFPQTPQRKSGKRKRVNIIMGGNNSERQVSLMSGTNVWLKLRHSKKYEPQPYLLDTAGGVWHLPYHLCLNHTVEEIAENCEDYQRAKEKLGEFEERARLHLGLLEPKDKVEFFEPKKLTLEKFFDESGFVFLALHGGDGENGAFQEKLASLRVKFNGPEEEPSRLCIDKWSTSRSVDGFGIEGVKAIPGKIMRTDTMFKSREMDMGKFWKETKKELGADTLIVKPRADGCTTGIVHLYSASDLKTYLELIVGKVPFIRKHTFKGQADLIEMPTVPPRELLFEKFIESDSLHVRGGKLKYRRKTGWMEITVGILEMNGEIRSLNPSITVVEGEVLTVEEKFQGGTGINLTPPPSSVMREHVVGKIRDRMKRLAEKVGIRGYCRIDAFANARTGDLQIIEINTLPGLTPSTVFYHQALAENPPIYPRELLETLIKNKDY